MKGIDRIDDRLILKSPTHTKIGKGFVSASIALSLSVFSVGKVKFSHLEMESHKKILEEETELKIESDAYDMIRESLY